MQAALNNSKHAVVGFGGSRESAENHRAAANAFLAKLDNRDIDGQSYTFPELSRAEALVVGGSVQYNMLFASFEDLGIDAFNGGMDAVTALVSDEYLYPCLLYTSTPWPRCPRRSCSSTPITTLTAASIR